MPEWRHREHVSESLAAERLQEIERSQAEIAGMWTSQRERESELQAPEEPSAEELVGKALVAAQKAAELILERAREEAARLAADAGREASPILATANRTLEEAKALYREAQMTLEQARLQAEALVEAAKIERQQLISDSVSAAAQRRIELDDENRRLGKAIHDLRAEWVTRASEALARLDRIAALAGSTEGQPALGAITDEIVARLRPENGDSGEPNFASDLHARLPESGAGPYPPLPHDPSTSQREGASQAPAELPNGGPPWGAAVDADADLGSSGALPQSEPGANGSDADAEPTFPERDRAPLSQEGPETHEASPADWRS